MLCKDYFIYHYDHDKVMRLDTIIVFNSIDKKMDAQRDEDISLKFHIWLMAEPGLFDIGSCVLNHHGRWLG